MSKNTCFYSNRCKVCEVFITELSQTSYKNEFQYVCVDPGQGGARPRLPGFLKKVPTLIVAGEDHPLVGNEAINWLWVKRMQDNKQETNDGASGAAASVNSGGDDMGLTFWNPLEMGGMSDSYSFIDQDTSVEGNGGMRIAQNFEFFGDAGPPPSGMRGTNHGQAPAQTAKKSAKENEFDNAMERYMEARNSGVPPPIRRM